MSLDELPRSRNLCYVKALLELVLKQGNFPPDAYRQTAEKLQVTYAALRQGFSRIAPALWEAGAGVFHKPEAPCPKPKDVLEKLVFYLSDGKIL